MDGFLSFVKQTVTAVGDEIKQQAALLAEDSLGVHYVTKRILAMGFPYDDSMKSGGATVALPVSPAQAASGVSVRQLAGFLHKNYNDHFMIWNLSEKTYDYTLLDNQVIEFRFPGYPAPPLNQVFGLCNSIHAWLQADDANIAVIHCTTGRGRTLCAIAWYLAWSGQVPSVNQAIAHVTRKLSIPPETALIPTQQRYLDYLSAMLAGKRPNTAPITLERVIMNGIPKLGDRRRTEGGGSPGSAIATGEEACRPYLQIFRDAKLVYTSTGRDSTELRWYTSADSCILFPVNLVLEGDILIRIRHLSSDNKRVSMLRFGFHTGFITPGNTRFLKAQLDGAYNDPRFDKSFWLDLIFRTPDASESTPASQEAQAKQQQYWDQVNSARRQTKPDKSGLESPNGRVQITPEAEQSTTTSNTTSPISSPNPSSTNTSKSSSKSLGSLFSSASSKLSSFSLFGNSSSTPSDGPDLSDPEVAKLHAADQAALKKAKLRAATEAAVQAALAVSPARPVAPPPSAVKKPLGSDPDGFADLQAYVSGLGNLDQRSMEVDSDQEESHEMEVPTTASKSSSNKVQAEELNLIDTSILTTTSSTTTTPAKKETTSTLPTMSDDDLFASLGLSPTISATNTTLTPAQTKSSNTDLLSPNTNASLEAELAALESDTYSLDLNGTGEEVVLDDADEAALLASLQDELNQ